MKQSASPDEAQQNNLGRIEGLAVPLILASIHQTGTTGVLHFTKGNIRKSLYIKEGDIIFATSSDHQDRLGELLIKKGKCTDKDLEKAVSRLGSGRRLGTILTEDERMTPEDLVENVMDQVQQIVFSIFEWDSGFYQYEEGQLPSLEIITLSQSTPELLFQGIREMSDMKILLRSLGGLKRRFVLDSGHREKLQQCLLSDEERKVAELLETPSSAEEILKATNLNTMDVIKTLVAMKITGLVKEEENPIDQAFEKDSPIRGDLLEKDLLDILGLLALQGVEGSLFIKSDPIEAGCSIKNGEILSLYLSEDARSFLNILSAETDDSEDTLAEDNPPSKHKEEKPAKESDETFGLKVLDEIMMLPEGEFIYLEGASLPQPEIKINKPIMALILEFMEKIDDWVRIEKGCGEPDTWLILTPSYLEAIDNISINDQLWDIISKLKAPCSVSEIISSFKVPKETLGRWLWFLQVAGAIKRFEEEDVKDQAELAELPELEAFQEESHRETGASSESSGEDAEKSAKTISEDPAGESAPKKKTSSQNLPSAEQTPPHDDLLEDLSHEAGSVDSLDKEWKKLVEEKDREKTIQKEKKATVLVESEKKTEEKAQTETEVGKEKPEDESKDSVGAEGGEQDTAVDKKIVEDIKKFNEKQKYIFEKLKSEMGAGTQNFIHYCQSRMGKKDNPFADISLGSDGDWDPSVLSDLIAKNGWEQYLSAFDKLLNIQLDMVGNFLSPGRKEELGKGIREIEKRQMKIE